ncbi:MULTISPECIES: DUF2497 domain-containing protein [unclassified Roseitalea]|uniref:PopZ family protein n=1 Tax=unclassified Roseitalea TaxID=2639107 RepID=UPI00273E188C|nr:MULTISPECIES: DUF2497 domain-containing protein [unclassified Roseitalea]
MGQAKPVDDQPSMDEILSSIRRIIDRGEEPARPAPPVAPVFDPPPPAPHSAGPEPHPVNGNRPQPATGPRADAPRLRGSHAAPNDADAMAGRPPLSREELDSFAEVIDARSRGAAADGRPAQASAQHAAHEERRGKYAARFSEDDSRAFARVASVLSETTGVAPEPGGGLSRRAEAEQRPDDGAAYDHVVNDQAPDIVHDDAPAQAKAGLAMSTQSPKASATGTRQADAPARRAQWSGHGSDHGSGHDAPARAATAPQRTQAGHGGSLVSARARQSVEMSFDALSATLREQAGRDLSEMAEDILKPMLSDWLDNNLPSMVERLVREEIERIARGEPRRD